MSELHRPQSLDASTLPLSGRHLIEASAGTGKTFNITRIYLRLLLERKLNVENILVMTFTKDATEELRGRVNKELRDALATLEYWHEHEDDFFHHLASKIDSVSAKRILEHALLHLDEAAIFTIHGFCKRVLTQQAFDSGIPFNVQMETDSRDIMLEAVRDWYRALADQPAQFELIHDNWPTPEAFINAFSSALDCDIPISTADEQQLMAECQALCQLALNDLNAGIDTIHTHLVEVKTGKAKAQRETELADLRAWLQQVIDDPTHALGDHSMPSVFFNRQRYPKPKDDNIKLAIKLELDRIFANTHIARSFTDNLPSKIQSAELMQWVLGGLEQIRAAFIQQKQQRNIMDFDDLIHALANALAQDPQQVLAQTLFAQFPVALVDEFQDTDPNQFAILRHIYFSQPDAALYMIGDPKQAIYAFRGGDVFAYLDARNHTEHQWQMGTNWRSSAAMITAYNRLFYGDRITEPHGRDIFRYGIPYLPVNASPKAQEKAFTDPDTPAALILADFPLNQDYKSARSNTHKATFRQVIANWCAAEIQRLLSQASINDQPIQHQDIAILVRDGKEAADIKQALTDYHIASVYLSNHDNLFASDEAVEIERVMSGILFAEDDRKFIAALSTRFFGLNSHDLWQLQGNEILWEQKRFLLIELRQIWMKRGFMSMALRLLQQDATFAAEQYERALTNIIHLFELLQTASQRHHAPQELLFWLQQQRQLDSAQLESELRLESDANLVRIVTQHGSKGLEYPIVFVPYVSRYKDPLRANRKKRVFMRCHDQHFHARACIGENTEFEQWLRAEADAETVRLLYVAVTRAIHRCYLGITAFENAHLSPIGQTLLAENNQDLSTQLAQLALDQPEQIQHWQIHADNICAPRLPMQQSEQATALAPAQFTGRIERDWWLSSFSALSRNIRHGGKSDPDRDQDPQTDASSLAASALRFTLAKGAHAGNLLHDILEHSDFSQPNWSQSMTLPLAKFGLLPEGKTAQDLADWLQECVETNLSSQLRLADLPLTQTLRETEFYFPMQGASSAALARILAQHRESPVPIGLPAYAKLSGMMHGFIDLIFEHQGQFFVCDYKSTHLGDRLEDYSKAKIKQNIEDNYYDLQYLIYSLALHRHLQQRLADYDPARHFGGVFYLYLRGMRGNNLDKQTGVYHRAISPQELQALDQLFAHQTQDECNYV